MANVIGLDIGGTKISGIVYNGKKIVRELTIVTPKNLYNFEKSVLKLTDFLSADFKISAIGVGMAGLVDDHRGIVRWSPNIKFAKNLNLVKFFKLNGYQNVKVDNDANCFTRGELLLGQGKKFKDFLALTLGTGVGGGIVINRQIYRGRGNAGAEFGQTVYCDRLLEQIYQHARDKKAFSLLGKVVGRAMASFATIFTPQAIIIGGTVGQTQAARYLPQAKTELKKFIFDKSKQPQVLISKLKNAGALGAALFNKN